MTIPTLSRTEASHLHAAAAHEGCLVLAATMKPTSRQRLIDRFLRDGLITPPDVPDGEHRLTPAGYRAIALAPPRSKRGAKHKLGAEAACSSAVSAAPSPSVQVAPPDSSTSKKAQVLGLLHGEDGATLAELMAATGWLPHTVRAALSRIRSAGQPLTRTARPDAVMAYRILPVMRSVGSRAPGKGRRLATRGLVERPAETSTGGAA